MTLRDVPEDQRSAPWVRSIAILIESQIAAIESQTKEITKLKIKIKELQDEISRLTHRPIT